MRAKAADSVSSSAKERTTRTPARLARTRSLIAPMASWLARVRANRRVEKVRVTSINAGNVAIAARVSLGEIVSMT